MNSKTLAFSFLCFLAGILAIALQREWIIIRSPSLTTSATTITNSPINKKKITLFFWHHKKWHQETAEVLWSHDKTANLKQLIMKWLAVLDEEQVSKKRISLQSVMLSAHEHDAYVSFDRNPLQKDEATMVNIMWFEGLLKTARENDIALNGVYFLVHHQPLQDTHIDFSHAWPLVGFVKN